MKSEQNRARSAAPLAVLIALGAATFACPDTLSALCPTDTRQEGIYTVVMTRDSGANECKINSDGDGGSLDYPLFGTDAGSSSFTAALCSSRLDDGGPAVWLARADPQKRSSLLGAGGTFLWHTETTFVDTYCRCPIYVQEQIVGRLLPAQDDGGTDLGDAGLPPLKGFTAAVYDMVDAGGPAPDGGPCLCNVPCTTTFTLDATKQ